jgi:hypothetical protein
MYEYWYGVKDQFDFLYHYDSAAELNLKLIPHFIHMLVCPMYIDYGCLFTLSSGTAYTYASKR